MSKAISTITTTSAEPGGAAPFDSASGAAARPVVIAFPPVAGDVATIAADVEQLPSATLLPLAVAFLRMAECRHDNPASTTANLHAVFGAMLMLCRVLDEAAYPWECAARRAEA